MTANFVVSCGGTLVGFVFSATLWVYFYFYFYFYFTITSKVGWGDHVRQLHELITGETSVFMEGRF